METTQKNEAITTTTADTGVEMAEVSEMPPLEGPEHENADNELFLPTIRNPAQQTKKSRKRLRKVINDTPIRESDDDSDDKSDWVANSIKPRRSQGRPGARYSSAPQS